mgnify:CR=1 FL=1
MNIVRSVGKMAELAACWRRDGKRIAFVQTMGALHEGHISLVRAARKAGDIVLVSIFVNPMQFGPKEDFRKYPRTLRTDARLLSEAGTDAVFFPAAAEMFPEGFVTAVSVRGLADGLCGRFRPGHFDGVATVVAKLFGIVTPHVAFFGQKDYQQCKVIERMAADLNMGVRIRMMPIVREPDGLAMSSRNRYLSAEDRKLASGLSQVLMGMRRAVAGGSKDARKLKAQAAAELRRGGIKVIDYMEIIHGDTLQPLKRVHAPAVAAAAIRLGGTRLLDNMLLAR